MASEPKDPLAHSAPAQSENLDEAAADVSPVVVEAIGKALKAHFRAIADVPLPDRFLVLLAELEAKEGRYDA
jgi:Anti-sigma factor NepR